MSLLPQREPVDLCDHFARDLPDGKKFIMLMDLYPVHCCRDFLEWSHEALPNMLLAFVPPGVTAQLQPHDKACMRTVKSGVRKAAGLSLAHDVVTAHRSGAILKLDMRPATVARPDICELAWRHLTVSPMCSPR